MRTIAHSSRTRPVTADPIVRTNTTPYALAFPTFSVAQLEFAVRFNSEDDIAQVTAALERLGGM